MKDRTDGSMVEVFKEICDYLRAQNLVPNPHAMDTKCSKAITRNHRQNKVKIHFVEPHNHCVNAAKVTVKAAKYHTLAALPTVNVTCPFGIVV